MKGIIVHLHQNGYGFIRLEDTAKQVFFHSKDLRGSQFEELSVNITVKIGRVEIGSKGTEVARMVRLA